MSKSNAVRSAVIFGSRARGDNKYNSDIDIAIYTDGELYPGFGQDLDEAAGIFKTNIIIMERLSNDRESAGFSAIIELVKVIKN